MLITSKPLFVNFVVSHECLYVDSLTNIDCACNGRVPQKVTCSQTALLRWYVHASMDRVLDMGFTDRVRDSLTDALLLPDAIFGERNSRCKFRFC